MKALRFIKPLAFTLTSIYVYKKS